jgi:predicted RND superfamily exporter protein
MLRLYETILKYPKSVIGAILLITLFFGWHMRKVELNNSIEELLPENHPSVLQDKEVKHIFNSREMILIGVLNDDGIFNPTTLQKVKELTDKIWQVTIVQTSDLRKLEAWGETIGGRYQENIQNILSDGLTIADRGSVSNLLVETRNDASVEPGFISFLEILQLKLSPLSDVISLAEVDNITSTEWGLNVNPPMETVPQTKEELAQLTSTIFSNEMFINGIVSQDSTGTVILAELAFYYDDHLEMAYQVFEKLEALTKPYQGPENILLAGVPMVNVHTSNYMGGDMAKLTPIVILLVMLVMYLSFRMLKGVFIPISVVLVALIWTLGVMGLVGRPITLVVSFMPVMLIAIGIADGIHLITEYKILWVKLKDHDRAILETMQRLTWPVILTSLTTMAGFASIATSNLRSIKDFGIYTTVGVFAAMIFSLTFVPAALKLMKPPKASFSKEKGGGNRLTLGLERLGDFAVSHRRWVFIIMVALAALSVLAVSQIKVGSAMVGMFQEDSEIVQASNMLNEKFGGTEVMNIVVDTKMKDGLKDPDVLGKIGALQDTLESLPIVGYSNSLADYVKRTNFVMNNNDPAYNRVPGKAEIVTEIEWVEQNGEEVEIERQLSTCYCTKMPAATIWRSSLILTTVKRTS